MPATPGHSGLLREITPRNLLSYGPDTEPIELRSLNVLIGPNGSGKSNLIEAITLLRSTPREAPPLDLQDVILKGGGVSEWVWKGSPKGTASISAVMSGSKGDPQLRHVVAFRAEGQRFRLEDERVENRDPNEGSEDPYFYYRYNKGTPR